MSNGMKSINFFELATDKNNLNLMFENNPRDFILDKHNVVECSFRVHALKLPSQIFGKLEFYQNKDSEINNWIIQEMENVNTELMLPSFNFKLHSGDLAKPVGHGKGKYDAIIN